MFGSRFAVVLSLGIITGFSSFAGASPYCAADLDDNSVLDIADILEFLDLFGMQDPQVDFDNNGQFNIFDVLGFLDEFNSCDVTDSDFDRIPDWAETDNGLFITVTSTGTDPNNADTDNDGLSDGDEILGTLDGLDLPALDANPLRKDIFVECDWFAGFIQGNNVNFRITPAGDQRLTDAFAFSGVANPYGLPSGISLHLDYGQGGAFTGGNQLPGAPVFVTFRGKDYNELRSNHFASNRVGYFHYAMLANRYNSDTNGSSGVAELHGDDMMVTLFSVNNDYNQTQTFMHELGHNLGLHHGGIESKNYKRNYNSVQNYRHQFPGVDSTGDTFGNGVLDYSHGLNNPINELAVFEPLGIIGLGVDFNFNGVIDFVPYALNLNCNSGTAACGEDSQCWDSVCDVLEDNDDWSTINWQRLDNAGLRNIEKIECDSTPPADG